ncbi:MAG: amino acid permease [Halobacteriovoraceae bacterium]|nr:amino acid permease [Halobacteriovoraceae bacterium]|tara:strand:+ start:8789 stop:10120 length:1332 start_codon:yes stop_codon:yes gene_type:complete
MSDNSNQKDQITLSGAIAMGTGVMIGAGIFALTGEIANYSGSYFIWAFIAAGLVAGLTSYTYIKMSNAYPSSGGIGMILVKAYGKTTLAAWGAVLMLFSMIINQSLVARTFGNYIVQSDFVNLDSSSVTYLGVGLIITSFLVNIMSNKAIQRLQYFGAFFKALGLIFLAIGGLMASGVDLSAITTSGGQQSAGVLQFIGSVAIGVLAFKGFTTITNSGGEITKPHKNVGRAIIYTLFICLGVYLFVTVAVSSSLSVQEIIEAKNYSLAEAARPTYGQLGVNITVIVAIIATITGIIASMFAVSRMLTMLTKMKLVPHKHFGMPGDIHKHVLVYIAVMAAGLTIVFDVSRIAAMGAFFYIVMDMLIHYGVLKNADRSEVKFKPSILVIALIVDAMILTGLTYIKIKDDPQLIAYTLLTMAIIYGYEKYFLKHPEQSDVKESHAM